MCQPAVVAAAGPGSAGAEGATDSVVNPVLKRDYIVLCFLLFPPAVKEGLHCTLLSVVSASC